MALFSAMILRDFQSQPPIKNNLQTEYAWYDVQNGPYSKPHQITHDLCDILTNNCQKSWYVSPMLFMERILTNSVQ